MGQRRLEALPTLGLVVFLGCVGAQRQGPPVAHGPGPDSRPDLRYVNMEFGFEIERPDGDQWKFAEGRDAPEGVVIPVAVVHEETGSQVVVQLAANVATAWEFAERLAEGLGEKHGFQTTTPQGIDDKRALFAFVVDDKVLGKVDVRSERSYTIVLLGTWPKDAPQEIVDDVDAIMASLRTLVPQSGEYAGTEDR